MAHWTFHSGWLYISQNGIWKASLKVVPVGVKAPLEAIVPVTNHPSDVLIHQFSAFAFSSSQLLFLDQFRAR